MVEKPNIMLLNGIASKLKIAMKHWILLRFTSIFMVLLAKTNLRIRVKIYSRTSIGSLLLKDRMLKWPAKVQETITQTS